ncbi:MAG: hypothetical protein B7C24_13995 [Bacteroidetes bacterium 4572_77]|nr:MAG: hypothetical protein B7C24_13995 [Bacteroidetes bacterium 4572_77]
MWLDLFYYKHLLMLSGCLWLSLGFVIGFFYKVDGGGGVLCYKVICRMKLTQGGPIFFIVFSYRAVFYQ